MIHPFLFNSNFMKKRFTHLLLVCTLLLLTAWSAMAQNTITGKLTDEETGEPLIGVNVVIKGTSTGTITDEGGNFSFQTDRKFPFTLMFSSIGYASKEIIVNESNAQNLSINLGQSTFMADEVVVSASRRFEKLTDAPTTINVVTSRNIEELPSFNLGELAARQKGVDYVRSGVLGTGLNLRGFNSAFNPKNLQINDYRISTLVATGLPFGPLSTLVKEDIDRVEIVLGPSSALYGPNATNGLVNTITKDPRSSEGTTFAVGFGNQQVYTGRFRHAQKVSDKFAFKVTGDYTRGRDFAYVDTVYLGSGPTAIARPELELNPNFETARGEAQFYYSPGKNSDIVLSYGGSNTNMLSQTNAGRNQIRDWQIHYLHLRFVSPRIFAQVYNTWSSTDSTYAINQRTQNYWSFRNAGFDEAESRIRSFSEQWIRNPALPGGGIAIQRGALFKDRSNRINAELQYNNNWGGFNVITGVQYQFDNANSRGTYLLDNGGNDPIKINQIGFYAQVEKELGVAGLKLLAAARADNHDLYGFNFIPKAALLKVGEKGTWRLTYGKGIAAPTILNLEANIFGGLLLGNGEGFTLSNGLVFDQLVVEKVQTVELGYKGSITKKLFFDGNAYFNFSKDFLSPAVNVGGITLNPAMPDGIFVTQRGSQPIQEVVAGLPAQGADFVLTYLNFGDVNTYGVDVGLSYQFTKNFTAILNYSWFSFSLDKNDPKNDGDRNGTVTSIDLPINTPAHKFSLALNYSSPKWFGSVFTRWVEAYDFFSGINTAAAANPDLGIQENARFGRTWNYGPLGGFVNVDVSLGYRLNNGLQVSGQVTNVFNSEVREFVASPAIGRLYSIEFKATLPPAKKKGSK